MTVTSLAIGLAVMISPPAQASLLMDFSVTPSSIATGGRALLDLHVTTHVDFPFSGSLIDDVGLTFSSGDGQSFAEIPFLFDPHEQHFQHQFTYSTPGVFFPSVTGKIVEAEPTASNLVRATWDVNLSSRLAVTSSSSTIPEPSAILLFSAGLAVLAGITWRRHRRK
jgi:hypothetical protein